MLSISGCNSVRDGGELRLKHEVTVSTPDGERSFASVVSMTGIQRYNHDFGGSGWGGISCRLTGSAVRVVSGDKDFYFLLSNGGTTPASTQIGLIKKFFGLPNAGDDAGWTEQWKSLAKSNLGFAIPRDEYPQIAVMPHGGWTDDARVVTLQQAEDLGLRIKSYTLRLTQEPVGPAVETRYRPAESRDLMRTIGRESFTVVNGTA
jgi:hypothetical protein